MIDLSHLAEAPGLVQAFGPTGTTTGEWQAWVKPRGYTMLALYGIGPGGGGGGGYGHSTANSDKGGGGGGSSGALSRVIAPLFLLPEVIWYCVSPGGSGGAGGAGAGVNGTAGNSAYAPTATYVSAQPSPTTQYLLLMANLGGGGVGGTATTAAGGTAAGINSTSACPLALLGYFLSIAGQAGLAGANGTTNAGGADYAQTTGSQLLPGMGGGASTDATGPAGRGGQINALANTPYLASAGGVAPGGAGSSGFRWGLHPKFYGGTGGAGSHNSVGGAGGNGCVPGTGGGGGGGGVTVGGRGGDGGPGLVIFHCFGG